MKEIIAIIRPEKYLPTIVAATESGAEEVMEQRVMGRGRQSGLRYLVSATGRPEETVQFLPKRMLTWFVPEDKAESVVEAIIRVNRTSRHGDGKIFVCSVDGRDSVVSKSAIG